MTARATAAKANCARRSPSPPAVPGIPGRSFISTPLGCSAGSGGGGGGGASTGCTAGLLANISPEFGRGVGGWARASLGFVLVLVGALEVEECEQPQQAAKRVRLVRACDRGRGPRGRESVFFFLFLFLFYFILLLSFWPGKKRSGSFGGATPPLRRGPSSPPPTGQRFLIRLDPPVSGIFPSSYRYCKNVPAQVCPG